MRATGDAVKNAHLLQSTSSSCVAACVCIVRRLRGEEPSDAEWQFERECTDFRNLDPAARLPGAYVLRGKTPEDDLREQQIALAQGDVVVTCVLGAPYMAWLAREYPRLSSPHGRLAPPGSWGGPLHAVVLVERVRRVISLLDPYHEKDPQPLQIEDEDLALCLGVAGVAIPRR
jgi:hypothetical protein